MLIKQIRCSSSQTNQMNKLNLFQMYMIKGNKFFLYVDPKKSFLQSKAFANKSSRLRGNIYAKTMMGKIFLSFIVAFGFKFGIDYYLTVTKSIITLY